MSITTEGSRREAAAVRNRVKRAVERGDKSFSLRDLSADAVQELRKGGMTVEWVHNRNHYLVSWNN